MLSAMHWLASGPSRALASALLLSACGDDESSADASSGPSSSSGVSSESGQPTTASGSGSSSSSEATSGTDSGSTSSVGTSADSTTGAEMLCNGWSEDGPATPWLELYDAQDQPLASGGTYSLGCGGQGSWMLPIFPRMGGWELAEPALTFSVEVVVEGFPGPFGSFYREPAYYYDLQCFEDTFDGGFAHDCIAVLPPDDITDLATLDGAPATIHLELAVDGGDPIVMDLVDLTLSAPADLVANGCGFG